MLIRVEIFPPNFRIDPNNAASTTHVASPVPPLFVCLGTCGQDGRLLTVGRKDAHVCFSSDKSVSRQHLELSLMCSSTSVKADDASRETASVRVLKTPSTPDQRKACKNNPLHMCLVATDLGSKYGSYLVEENKEQQHQQQQKVGDDDSATEGDDETDDEHAVARQAADSDGSPPPPPLSAIASSLVGTTATLERVESSGTMLLPDITRMKDNRLILQCGHHGSTLVLTYLPLTLAWSTVDTSTRELWRKRLLWLGATSLDQNHAVNDSMTHLIANERKSNAKHLCAWVLQRPILTTQYLQGLWDRSNPSDPMPNLTECRPTDPQKSKFWNETRPSSLLFQDWTLLSLVEDDMECLCRAAGCTLVQLHALRTEKQFASKLTQLQKQQQQPQVNGSRQFVIISMSSPPNKKVEKRLHKLQATGIAVVTNQKLIARSVAYQEKLKDVDGKVVGGGDEQHAVEPPAEVAARDSGNESDPAASESLVTALPNPEGEEKEETRVPVASSKPLEVIPEEEGSSERQEQTPVGQDASTEDTSTVQDVSMATEPPQPPRDAGGWISSKKRTSSSLSMSQEESSQEQHAEAQPLSQKRRLAYHAPEEDDDDDGNEQTPQQQQPHNRDVGRQKPQHATRKSKLATLSDGWLVAAPHGAERSAYRISNKELQDYMDGGEVPAVAPTSRVSNLVVSISNKPTVSNASTKRGSSSKDFKKFRKNVIYKVATSDRVIVKATARHETEAQHALEEEHRRLEEEERLADALFGDPDRAPAKKVRRQ